MGRKREQSNTVMDKAPGARIKELTPIIVAVLTTIGTIIVALIAKWQGPVFLTLTPSATPACPYHGKNDNETFINLISAEAVAVNTESMEIINTIFAPDAYFYDVQKSQSWSDPEQRYQDDLFSNGTSQRVEHFGVSLAGKSPDGAVAWATSGSSGFYDTNVGDDVDYYNGAKGETEYGSDHWTFRRNATGCWVISQFEFNAGAVRFP